MKNHHHFFKMNEKFHVIDIVCNYPVILESTKTKRKTDTYIKSVSQ